MRNCQIALIGDFDEGKLAHRAINRCFALATQSESLRVEPRWLGTEAITSGDGRAFESLSGIWCVPGSPYRNTEAALWAVRYARTRPLPFLGTCGGFQHALLEYAHNVLGLKGAAHAEFDPGAEFPLLHRMECALVEKSQPVNVIGHHFRTIYGATCGQEDFHCSYGLNPRFENLFKDGPLDIVARSEDGQVRAVELRGHPFYIGTLFQPERQAFSGDLHPVVRAFFAACKGGLRSEQTDRRDRRSPSS